MDSIIRTIVDMDKRARKRTMEEQEFFEKADSELAAQTKEIQSSELERADREIAENAVIYQRKLKTALEEITTRADRVSEELDEQKNSNSERWVQELADRAINEN